MDNQSDEDSESSGDENEANDVVVTDTPRRARSLRRAPSKTEKQKKQGFWDGMLTRLFDSTIMQSIEGRAAMVHNFMRGLSLNDMYPFSPFTEMDEDETDSSSASKNGEWGEREREGSRERETQRERGREREGRRERERQRGGETGGEEEKDTERETVSVCVCVRVRARARTRECMCVC